MKDENIVILGTLPPPLGGTTVLFKSFVDYLRREAKYVVVCDMARAGLLRVFSLSFLRIRTKFVLFNVSSVRIRYFIAVWLLFSIFRKKYAFRGFGGGWDVVYSDLSVLERFFFRRSLKAASFVCFETRHLVSFFSKLDAGSICWLPNTRSDDARRVLTSAPESERFIYLGRICDEKGVRLLLEAIQRAKGEIEVYFFGPIDGDFDFDSVRGAEYCGVMDPDDVIASLRRYKALVLPTRWTGEGYPGVVLEAFAAGIPVLSSRWRAIPELFEGNEALLFDPSSVEDLLEKMLGVSAGSIDTAEIVRRQKSLLSQFSPQFWNEKLLAMCRAA